MSMAAFSNAAGALVATKLGAMETDFTQIYVKKFYLREADILRYEDKYLQMGHNYSTLG